MCDIIFINKPDKMKNITLSLCLIVVILAGGCNDGGSDDPKDIISNNPARAEKDPKDTLK